MERDLIKGNWNILKGKLRQQWGELTDNDISQMQGTYEELEGRLQKLYGYKKERAKSEIESFLQKQHISEKV